MAAHQEVLKKLQEDNAEYEYIRNIFDETLYKGTMAHLLERIKEDDVEYIKNMVDQGINLYIYLFGFRDDFPESHTILHAAAMYGAIKIVKYLVNDCKQRPAEGLMALAYNKKDKKNNEIVQWFDHRDAFQRNAFFYAVRKGHSEIEEFLRKKGSNINLVDLFGETAFKSAADATLRAEMIEILRSLKPKIELSDNDSSDSDSSEKAFQNCIAFFSEKTSNQQGSPLKKQSESSDDELSDRCYSPSRK